MRRAIVIACLLAGAALPSAAFAARPQHAGATDLRHQVADLQARLARADAEREAAEAQHRQELQALTLRLTQLEGQVGARPAPAGPAGDHPHDGAATPATTQSADATPLKPLPQPTAEGGTPGPIKTVVVGLDHGRILDQNGVRFGLLAGTGGGLVTFDLQGRQVLRSGNIDTLGVTLSAPVDKDPDARFSPFATLDGLANDLKLELNWTRQFAPLSTFGDKDAWQFGLRTALGYHNFTYYDAATLAKQQVSHFDVSGGAEVSWLMDSATLTGGVRYEHAFEAAKSHTACNVLTVPSTVQCVTGALAAPVLTDSIPLSLELRAAWRLPHPVLGVLNMVGIAPHLELDALSNDWSIDVPVYLVPDEHGALSGGFRVGYSSHDGKVIGSIFVSSALGPLPPH